MPLKKRSRYRKSCDLEDTRVTYAWPDFKLCYSKTSEEIRLFLLLMKISGNGEPTISRPACRGITEVNTGSQLFEHRAGVFPLHISSGVGSQFCQRSTSEDGGALLLSRKCQGQSNSLL